MERKFLGKMSTSQNLHLIKLSVGSESPDSLELFQQKQSAQFGGPLHRTRMFPKRRDEILESGGSIYWVIKGQIRCRQKILDIVREETTGEKPMTVLWLDAQLIRTRPRRFRAFQGWRYFEGTEAPEDTGLSGEDLAVMPRALRVELEQLGLL